MFPLLSLHGGTLGGDGTLSVVVLLIALEDGIMASRCISETFQRIADLFSTNKVSNSIRCFLKPFPASFDISNSSLGSPTIL
jgi:hypothetical protein